MDSAAYSGNYGAAILIRKGLTPYQITRSSEWKGGKNIDTVLGYLDRAVGQKIPQESPLLESEILYTISRSKRELLLSAISKRESYAHVWEQHKDIWTDVYEVRADLETVRRYGQIDDKTGKPGDRLGYLFEDIWAIERRLHETIETFMKEKFGDQWWTVHILKTLTPDQMQRLKSYSDAPLYSDVTLLDLVRIAKKNWVDINPLLGRYSGSKPALFEDDFYHLNKIRNGLFHPARGCIFIEDDFELARHVRKILSNQ